jgi:hypothetical protein
MISFDDFDYIKWLREQMIRDTQDAINEGLDGRRPKSKSRFSPAHHLTLWASIWAWLLSFWSY